jgi:integrase
MAWRMAKLTRRKSGAWGARITIPKDVRTEYQAAYSKHVDEIFYAPPDCPPQRAQVLFSEWQAAIKSQIATLRAKQRGEGRDLTQREALALAGEWYRWWVGQHEENPGPAQDWQAWRWDFESSIEGVLRDPKTGEIGELDMADPAVRQCVEKNFPYLAATAAQFLTSKGENLTPAAMAIFLEKLISNLHTAMVLLERRAQGDYSPDEHLQTLPEYRRNSPRQSAAQLLSGAIADRPNSITAMQLFEGHVRASKLAPGTVSRRRRVFATLDAHLGGGGFDALSPSEAQQWVTSLTEKNDAATVMKVWVASLKAAGRWGVKQGLIATNPFAECSIPVPKKAKDRETKAFSNEEISLILRSASAIKDTRTTGAARRRWVLWICAYTGARAGEITQLRGKDVIERDGIKAIRITPDAGSVKTKQARTVPIHEHLVEQGFLDYVKAKGRGPLFYDPAPSDDTKTESSADTDITKPKTSRAVRARNRLGVWVRSLGIVDKEVSPTHGWRHTFKQIADRHGISDRVSDAITGHAPPTEGRARSANIGRHGRGAEAVSAVHGRGRSAIVADCSSLTNLSLAKLIATA